MNPKELQEKLDRIEEAITAKGHPMQDPSTIKMAMLDIIEVMRTMITQTET